jgi:hypothetical protein
MAKRESLTEELNRMLKLAGLYESKYRWYATADDKKRRLDNHNEYNKNSLAVNAKKQEYWSLIKELSALEARCEDPDCYLVNPQTDLENVVDAGIPKGTVEFWGAMIGSAQTGADMRAQEFGIDISDVRY